MATTSSFTSTGALQYLQKNIITNNILSTPAINPLSNLVACNVFTDIQSISFKVAVQGVILAHFIVDNIVSWEVSLNIIVIKTKDEVAYTLSFVSVGECIIADDRINNMMNGQNVIEC